MAAIASGVIEKVLEKIGSVAYKEFCLAWGVKSDLTKLKSTMSMIRQVLLDAEKKQASDSLQNLWLGQLNDVLQDAEDVLDEIQYQALRRKVVETSGSTSRMVRHFFSSSMTHPCPFKLAHKIKDIRVKLDEIAKDKDYFILTKIREDKHQLSEMTHSYVNPLNVIGRDKDKENIINLLIRPNASRNIDVIPIVGSKGLGKTTLAQLVYNDERVAGHFPLRMWVCVSYDFSLERLIKDILISACTIGEKGNVDTLQTKLRKFLKDKKFLLVLDDVRNDIGRDEWIKLTDLLIGGSKESKIIVTTCTNEVASIMSTVSQSNVQYLEGLSPDDCLLLFVKFAFEEGEDKKYPNLLKIGKEIVEKSKGIPFVVRTLGCKLYSKVDECEWESVRDNHIQILEDKNFRLFDLPASRSSYNQMQIHLEQCLIRWKMLEDVGDLYLTELLSRSFFQAADKKKCFLIHDIIRDLTISVTQFDSNNNENVRTIRHLSFSKMDNKVPKILDKLTKVRTVMFTMETPVSIVEACISRFKYLRLLDLSNSSFEVLSSSIGTLKHLRYLSLSGNERIKKLPNSICKLHNLQTLLLGGCRELERLPKDTRNMIGLRDLAVTIKYTCLLENGSLDSLQSLGLVSCPKLEALFQGMEGCLTNLRLLFIYDCESLTSLSLNIKHLTALKVLYIARCPKLSLMGEEDNQDLNMSLQNLEIEDLPKLEGLPQWLRRSANTLKLLRIGDCENFGDLPEWLSTLESLHTLEIIKCPKLSSLPEGIDCLTALRKLKIRGSKLSRTCKGKVRLKMAARVPSVVVELDEETESHSTEENDEVQKAHW